MTDLTKIIVAAVVGGVVSFSSGCSRKDSGPTNGLDSFLAIRDSYCTTFDPNTITRCDRSTFHVLMNAMCSKPLPTEYEYPSGKWNRDLQPCYPEDSRSETSQDAYLSVILSQDTQALQRVYAYAKPKGWETGLPEGNVGNIFALVPLLRGYGIADSSDGVVDDGIEAAEKAFTGHRGHLLAGYLWAVSRMRGGLTVFGTSLLKKVHNETPDSPYLSCLYHRHSDGKQSGTKALLRAIQPNDQFGWGSSVMPVHYALTVACLEGL